MIGERTNDRGYAGEDEHPGYYQASILRREEIDPGMQHRRGAAEQSDCPAEQAGRPGGQSTRVPDRSDNVQYRYASDIGTDDLCKRPDRMCGCKKQIRAKPQSYQALSGADFPREIVAPRGNAQEALLRAFAYSSQWYPFSIAASPSPQLAVGFSSGAMFVTMIAATPFASLSTDLQGA